MNILIVIKADILFYFQSIEKNYICFQCFLRLNLLNDNNKKKSFILHPLVVKLNVLNVLDLLCVEVSTILLNIW